MALALPERTWYASQLAKAAAEVHLVSWDDFRSHQVKFIELDNACELLFRNRLKEAAGPVSGTVFK